MPAYSGAARSSFLRLRQNRDDCQRALALPKLLIFEFGVHVGYPKRVTRQPVFRGRKKALHIVMWLVGRWRRVLQ